MTNEIDDATREQIITLIEEGDLKQKEIAEETGVSQASVSNIKSGMERGRKAGRKEGFDTGYEAGRSFQEDDETEADDQDEYWCQPCEDEGNGKVEIDYLQAECPNGHDLSAAWSDFE